MKSSHWSKQVGSFCAPETGLVAGLVMKVWTNHRWAECESHGHHRTRTANLSQNSKAWLSVRGIGTSVGLPICARGWTRSGTWRASRRTGLKKSYKPPVREKRIGPFQDGVHSTQVHGNSQICTRQVRRLTIDLSTVPVWLAYRSHSSCNV